MGKSKKPDKSNYSNKMVSSYKKYWFVLEGRLLLYYRSKAEYETLSPCKGSINLGPPCFIKPCSVNGVFQIETRGGTVTLRALNRDDQNKWMQAIMSAVNQHNLSNSRLSHFRYSLDNIQNTELSETKSSNLLERQKTFPYSNERNQANHTGTNIIQKLQRIGGQSHMGSTGAICKLAKAKTRNPKKANSHDSVYESECLYATVDMREKSESSERIATLLIDNENYAKPHNVPNNEIVKNQEHIYQRISGDSNSSEASKKENIEQVYAVPHELSNSQSSSKESIKIIIENDDYCSIDNINEFRKDLNGKHLDPPDHNKNSIIIENDQYCSTEQNRRYSSSESGDLYAEVKFDPNELINEPDRIKLTSSSHTQNDVRPTENEYEYTDAIYSVPVTKQTTEETSSQSSSGENKNKIGKFKSFRVKLKRNKEPKEENQKSLKKSSSFIKRVWKRRSRSKSSEETSNKTEITDTGTVQMLHELQNILENKRPILLQKSISQENSEDKATNTSKNSSRHSSVDESNLNTESLRPEVPPKSRKSPSVSPYHDYPTNNQPVANRELLSEESKNEKLRSIDEILNDLDDEDHGKHKVKKLIKKFSADDFTDDDVHLRHGNRSLIRPKERYSDELSTLLDELSKVTSAPILTPGVTTSLVNPILTDDELLKLLPIRRRRLSEPDYDVPRPHKSLQNVSKKEEQDNIITATRFFGPILTVHDTKLTDVAPAEDSSPWPSMTPDSLELTTPPSYTSHNYFSDNKKEPNITSINEESQLLKVRLPLSRSKSTLDQDLNNRKVRAFIGRQFSFEKCDVQADENLKIDIYSLPKPSKTRDVDIIKNLEDATFTKVNKIGDHDESDSKIQDVFVDSLELCTEISTAF